jgi:transcriptional regulator with XRE-family HTH domain
MPNNLKHLREQRGISQKEFAEMLGISRFHLNKIENNSNTGRNLTAGLALKAAKILKVSLDQIFLDEK